MKRLYTDDDGSFRAAAREFKWRHDYSKPHDPQANGLIEVHVGIVKSGARALLFQAGMPALCWPWAVKYFCQMRNMMDRYNRFGTLISSPYFRDMKLHTPGSEFFLVHTLSFYPLVALLRKLPPKWLPKLFQESSLDIRKCPWNDKGLHCDFAGSAA